LRIPKGLGLPVVRSEKFKIVDAVQFILRAALEPVFKRLMHCNVMLWHVERMPYVEGVKAALSGINTMAGMMKAVTSP
jgi:hypothetical protein